jgi:CubicO group peptidase (beta-lactamase class C family)
MTMGHARADGTPLAEDAIFRMASMTKPLTSVAFMMLLEEGKVALDDPVTKVIPEFAGMGVYTGGGGDAPFFPPRPATSTMRMVDLLTHMSGLTYGIQNRTNVDAAYRKGRLDGHPSLAGNDHFIAELAKLPLEFDPGTGWNYSVGTDVLGVIVARLSGMSLGEFFQARIFGPLGMVDTGFSCPPEKAHRLTDSWAWRPARWWPTPGSSLTPAATMAGAPRWCSGLTPTSTAWAHGFRAPPARRRRAPATWRLRRSASIPWSALAAANLPASQRASLWCSGCVRSGSCPRSRLPCAEMRCVRCPCTATWHRNDAQLGGWGLVR